MELHQVPARQAGPRHRALLADHEAREDRRRHREGAGLLTVFTARTSATSVVPAGRQAIWDVLVDPVLLARFTPFITSITPSVGETGDGDDCWVWEMAGVEVLGRTFHLTFTEHMVFDEPGSIVYTHVPPAGTTERAGVEGRYTLTDAGSGDSTRLGIELEVSVDLPLPRVSGPAVRVAMKGVMATMGERFSRNLLAHLATRR